MLIRRHRRPPVPLALTLPLWLALLLLCRRGLAERMESQDLPCGLVEKDNIHVDGLLSDWDGVDPTEILGVPPKANAGEGVGRPLKVRARCNYDQGALYLMLDIEDDVLVRTKAAGLAEDHIELGFSVPGVGKGVDRLLLWPSLYKEKIPRAARWLSGRPLRFVEGEGPAGRDKPLKGPPVMEGYDALQRWGYSFELRVPFGLLPGYKPGVPLPLTIRVVDVDSRARPLATAVAETAPLSDQSQPQDLSQVLFEDAQAGLTALLSAMGAGRSDIWWERAGNIGGGPCRILLIGRSLATISQQFGYQDVALVRSDIKDVQLVDVGEGQAVLIRVTETGASGTREVVRLWRVSGGAFKTVFATEVRKQKGADVLESQVSFVKRGKVVELVVTPKPPVGFTKDTYAEVPADDVTPILLPWEAKKVRYLWKNGSFVRAD